MAAELKLALVLMRFLRLCFAYTFNVDTTLDAEFFARSLHELDQLKEPAMTIAQQLHAKGKLEGELQGKLEGERKGVIKGQIRLMRDVLGESPDEEKLEDLSQDQLQGLLAALNVRFRQALR
jgi:hypothetical protein